MIDARNVIARGAGADVKADPAPTVCPGGHPCYAGVATVGYSNFVSTSGVVDASTVGHNQSADPLLVNPVVGPGQDFHIACPNSPAIGAGSLDDLSGATDRDGVAHPNPPSIGAYEFTGSAACGGGLPGAGVGGSPGTGAGAPPTRATISALRLTNSIFTVGPV